MAKSAEAPSQAQVSPAPKYESRRVDQSADAPGTASESTAAVTPQEASSAPAATLSSESSSEPLPQGLKVLHVGDSFAGALGVPLGEALEAKGLRSVLKHTDASYLTTWAWQGDLQKHLDKYVPDLVLVTLGANELAITEPEQRVRAIRKIVSTIGSRPCIWVAIPLWQGKHNRLLEVIREHIAPCAYLDTNALMDTGAMPRIHDGIHPTVGARKEWASVVLKWVEQARKPGVAGYVLRQP